MRPFIAVTLFAAALLLTQAVSLARQNQTPGVPTVPGQRPATGQNTTPGQPTAGRPPTSGNQTPAGNQTAPAPEPLPPPGIPIYVSPGIVQVIQQKLLALGYAVPTVSGAWGDNSAAALAKFQVKSGLDAGGDLDELTLLALGMPEVLRGELPPGADAPVATQAATSGGAPLSASPRLARQVQNKLTESGYPTDNVFGIWMAGSESAARAFQKAKGLDVTGTLDLRVLHALELTSAVTEAKAGKLPTDSVASILPDRAIIFTGTPLTIGPAGIKQIQNALKQRGMKDLPIDGKWNEAMTAALKKFQEEQKLEASGSVNLRTLRALGFNNPLAELDQAPAAAPTRK